MKKLLLSATLFVAFCSLNSCAKCLKCKNAIESTKVCTKDKEDQADLDNIKASWERVGYKCTLSSGGL